MSHITKEEYLSAFLDGESGSFEQQRLSDQLGADDLMQEKLSNYALIGESVRNQSQSLTASSSFLAGIQDAISEDECVVNSEFDAGPVKATEKIEKKRFFPSQTIGYAVAASVAAIAAVSLQNYLAPVPNEIMAEKSSLVTEMATKKVAVMSATVATRPKVTVESTSYAAPNAEVQGLMNQYVAHHLQYASTSTMMPRLRAVSYSTGY